MIRQMLTAVGAVVFSLALGGTDRAAGLENGDRITMVVTYSPGGGFDTQTRLIAPYLESALRSRGFSDVDVIVTNIRGGGGATGTSQVYAAEPDGTTLMMLDPESSLWQQTLSNTMFDLGDFTYLAQVSADPFTLSVRENMDVENFPGMVERAQTTPILVATSGHGASDHILPLIIQKVLKDNGTELPMEFLFFGGTSDKLASMRRDEAEMTAASTVAIRKFVDNGEVKVVLSFGETGDVGESGTQASDLLGLPDEDYRSLAAGAYQRRVIAAPPGMDDATRDMLREVLDEVLNDSDLLAKAETANQVITYLSGGEVFDEIRRELGLAARYGDYVRENVEK